MGTSPAFTTSRRDRRALFVAYGASHLAKVAPVVQELERLGVECLLLALTIAYKQAQQLGLKPLGYKDFLHLADDPLATLARGKSLMAGNNHPDVEEHETCCYLGINYQEWVVAVGEAGAAVRYEQQGRQGFLPVSFMGKVIDALQPGVVVATSTPRSEQAAIEAALDRGIPTLTMVDLFAPPSDPFLRRPRHADRVTVVSDQVKQNFVAAGLEPWRVAVTGSPDFDALFAPQSSRAGATFLQRMGWEGLKIVLWAGILEPEGTGASAEFAGTGLGSRVEQRLRQWVADSGDAALIVRYHPSQYHRFPDQGAQDRVYVSNSGAELMTPFLHASDIVINQVSTVGLEAALLRKRVLHLQFSQWAANLDFDLSSFGASEAVPGLDSLVPMIEASEQELAGSKMTVPDGPAAPRVAAQVMGLLEE